MNASSISSVPAERPVHPLAVALLAAVKTTCQRLGTQFVLAGATARDIQFLHLHGVKAPTATRDVDVAVCAVSWEFHERLIDELLSTGQFTRNPKAQQQLIFWREAGEYGVPLDLVPFGPIEAPPGAIAWPPDGDIVMNVLGFEEAAETAQQVNIGEGLVVPVVTIPAFMLLKIMAWQDRRNEKNTDASDLLFVLRQFFFAGNEARVYEEAMDLLEACDFKVEIAAAGLLGRDAWNIAHPQTREAVGRILQTRETYAALKADLFTRAAAFMSGEFVDDSDDLLDAFKSQFLNISSDS
ncbi:nucleotidyl transferase AbiEii/AbiGii toxin family protein [Paraburkholderia sp. HD33-4]|uniref:nucleotidyl transferase AbiEii/AbiGii toxin family protein n=1 Tax=Paraburkholderia sp. HD33-4 TaxID=2883242 RepID=UPI001F2ACA67|nr:nucleotidyl transferase AbiEii/AbiGii toxin family protein [Paraburkholderia sp. HD33-4]